MAQIGPGITFGGGVSIKSPPPPPSPTFFPLSNTAVDPTSATWQNNNLGIHLLLMWVLPR